MRILDVTVQPRRNPGRFIQERSPRRANKQGYRLLGNAPPKTTSNHNSISECSSLPSRNLRRLGRRRRRLRSRHTNTYGKHNYSKPGRGQMATLTTDLLKARPGKKRVRPRVPIDLLLDTGGDGGSYMSVSLYCTLRKWGGVSQKLRTKGKGSLHAANPAIAVRVVDELPYGLIIGARFLRTNNSVLDVGAGRGFKQTPSSRWIPFIERSMSPVIAPLAWNRFCAPHQTMQK